MPLLDSSLKRDRCPSSLTAGWDVDAMSGDKAVTADLQVEALVKGTASTLVIRPLNLAT
jgi:hypothetical protein